MNPYYIWFIIFGCLGYLIVSDSSVARLFVLIGGWIKFQYEKIKWIILNDPGNPIVKYLIWRRSLRLAKELEKEFKK